MTSRNQTRPRPTPRRRMDRSYRDIFETVLSRRALLGGSATLALVAGATTLRPLSAFAQAPRPSSLIFPELARVNDAEDHWPEAISGRCSSAGAIRSSRHRCRTSIRAP